MKLAWRIVPLHTPVVARRCPRCNVRTGFVCADKFRINGNGRRLDVWLIYKCSVCEQTWNLTVLSRVTPESIAPGLLQAFTDNDEATAWRYAFDHETLRKNDADAEIKVETRIEGPALDWAQVTDAELEIAIDFEHYTRTRLETLLSSQLGLSRKALLQLHAGGGLRIEPKLQDDLAKAIKRPVTVTLDVAAAKALLAQGR